MTGETMPPKSQLRGHWMLAGIFAGDWGVDQQVIDAEKARYHVIEIVAGWPDSPEAKRLKRWLLWDDETDQSRHDYLPKIHSSLMEF